MIIQYEIINKRYELSTQHKIQYCLLTGGGGVHFEILNLNERQRINTSIVYGYIYLHITSDMRICTYTSLFIHQTCENPSLCSLCCSKYVASTFLFIQDHVAELYSISAYGCAKKTVGGTSSLRQHLYQLAVNRFKFPMITCDNILFSLRLFEKI